MDINIINIIIIIIIIIRIRICDGCCRRRILRRRRRVVLVITILIVTNHMRTTRTPVPVGTIIHVESYISRRFVGPGAGEMHVHIIPRPIHRREGVRCEGSWTAPEGTFVGIDPIDLIRPRRGTRQGGTRPRVPRVHTKRVPIKILWTARHNRHQRSRADDLEPRPGI